MPGQAATGTAGTVTGCVTDSLKKPLGPAWLSLTNDNSDLRTTAGTDGCFEFRDVPPATYTIRTAVPAFCDGVLERVTVGAGQRLEANFSLKPGPISESIVFAWKGWNELVRRTDAVIHLRIEEVLDTESAPGKGCGSDIHTKYRVHALSVIKRPHWSSVLVAGPMVIAVDRTRPGSPASPSPYKAGDEFIAFLKWVPIIDSLELNVDLGGALVPIKNGRVAWTWSDDGKLVEELLEELRRLAK